MMVISFFFIIGLIYIIIHCDIKTLYLFVGHLKMYKFIEQTPLLVDQMTMLREVLALSIHTH